MTEVAFAPYDASRRDDYLRLLREAWGDGAMSAEEFDWWFDGNPAGSLMSVALRGEEVVGVASHSLCRMVVGGEERTAQFSVHAVTDPSARGLGVFRGLEVRNEEQGTELGSAAVFGFASAPTHPIFLGPLGWAQIDWRRVWARPLRSAARRLRGRSGRGGLGPGVGKEIVGVERVDTFDGAADRSYGAVAARLANHLVRDSRYLNWRYGASPKDYRCFRSANGLAVVGHTVKKGASLALLMELVAPPSEAAALVRRCVAEASAGADAMLAVPSPLLPQARLARLGFVPTTFRLDFIGKGLCSPLDADPSHWSVSLGDADFF